MKSSHHYVTNTVKHFTTAEPFCTSLQQPVECHYWLCWLYLEVARYVWICTGCFSITVFRHFLDESKSENHPPLSNKFPTTNTNGVSEVKKFSYICFTLQTSMTLNLILRRCSPSKQQLRHKQIVFQPPASSRLFPAHHAHPCSDEWGFKGPHHNVMRTRTAPGFHEPALTSMIPICFTYGETPLSVGIHVCYLSGAEERVFSVSQNPGTPGSNCHWEWVYGRATEATSRIIFSWYFYAFRVMQDIKPSESNFQGAECLSSSRGGGTLSVLLLAWRDESFAEWL